MVCSAPKPNSTFRLSTIDETFVYDQLKKIKTSESTGLTHIPARLLKDGRNALAKPLTVLMNRSLAEGTIPSEWKHAMVTPVYKSGSKTDAANYRPISVLPCFVKILERAVHSMVYHYLQENQLLSIYQSGFRPLHSTGTCLIDTTNKLLHNIDRGLLTGMVFLDLCTGMPVKQAKNRLQHNLFLNIILLKNLVKHCSSFHVVYVSLRMLSPLLNCRLDLNIN